MNTTSERRVYVHLQLPDSLETVPVALIKVRSSAGTDVGTFRYGDRYLDRGNAISLDPVNLPLGNKEHAFTTFGGIPGAVRDAAPDAWGRRVIEHKLEKTARDLHEVDYLLHGPQDAAGYLSFSSERLLQASKREFNKIHQLRDLVDAAQRIEEGKRVPEHLLNQLEPGTSMGGARPKATVEDSQVLWLAKFPEKNDTINLQRIERGTLELASRCRIVTPHARLEAVGGKDVLMIQRFDRRHAGEGRYFRLGLVSGLTVLGADEHYSSRDRWSYPLLAEKLRKWSESPVADCEELYRRMVFNAAVTNNDDHPRNHALLRDAKGWRLSPVYDLVPYPAVSLERRDLAMEVGSHGRTASIYNILSEAPRFGLNQEAARNLIDEVVAALRDWRKVFEEVGVTQDDIKKMEPAFLPPCFFAEKPVGSV